MAYIKGSYDLVLAIDCETSGLFYNEIDPSFCTKTNEIYQPVSWGMVVADAKTLKPIEDVYFELKHDTRCVWSTEAEAIHGLSRGHLKSNGLSMDDGVATTLDFIYNHWDASSPKPSDRNIRMLGHNVGTFDIYYFRRMFHLAAAMDMLPPTGNRYLDTSSIGWATFNAFTSDQLFNSVCKNGSRDSHNSLDDAYLSLEAARCARRLSKSFFIQ